MFQKHVKRLLFCCSFIFFLLLGSTSEAAQSVPVNSEALQTASNSLTNRSSSAKPVKYTYKGKKLNDSFFMYRSLLSSTEKAAYDELYQNLAAGKSQTVLKTSISTAQAEKVVEAVIYDNPEFFWIESEFSYRYSSSGLVNDITVRFNATASNLKESQKIFKQAAQPALKKASKAKTTIEKVKIIHDYLTNTTDYQINSKLNQSAYSALVNHSSVCAGYAKAFTYLMNQLGIRSAYVIGTTGEDHAWNLVEIDKQWYNIDVTWDDPVGNPADVYYYTYFNLTDKQIGKDHAREGLSLQLPKCTATKYAYKNCKKLFGKNATSGSDNPETTISDTLNNKGNTTASKTNDSGSYSSEALLKIYNNSPDSLSYWNYYEGLDVYYYVDDSGNVILIYEDTTDSCYAITADQHLYFLNWKSGKFEQIS